LRKLLTADLILESNSVNENTDRLTSAVNKAAELSIPLARSRRTKRLIPLPYWNEEWRNV